MKNYFIMLNCNIKTLIKITYLNIISSYKRNKFGII